MKLHRLHVSNLAAIADTEVEFGPGLNVLYGPNDLGKSTMVAAIRLALLLPHTSTHCDEYVPWTGDCEPMVDLTFETEPQRIWRVKKVFGRGGSSLLQESKNGQDFDDVARARGVDAKLRQILRWGIAEPGGTGGSKGLPPSFLATALLSTQADVTAMFHESLQMDATSSGKERIAAALQAVAQDPLFVTLLRCTQARRDEAYTDKGARRTGKGSVFKAASERLKAVREEKEDLQRIVADSQGAEKLLQELTAQRAQKQEALAVAADRVTALERLATQAADCAAAAAQVYIAEQEVARIRRIDAEVEAAQATVTDLIQKITHAEQALETAHDRQTKAAEALDRAEDAARSQGSDPDLSDTVFRQELELRSVAANHDAISAQQRIDAAVDAEKRVNAAVAAERAHKEQQNKAKRTRALAAQAADKETAASRELQRCDLLERAQELQIADTREAEARTQVEKESALRERFDVLLRERTAIVQARAGFTVPLQGELPRMRKLATDLAASQRALEVGLVVTVTPNRRVNLSVRKDGTPATSTSTAKAFDIEAAGEVEVTVADVANVRVRGGRRQAQENARILEDRWNQEVVPHFTRAGVLDLEGLDAKLAEARELDANLKAKDEQLETLRSQIASMADAGNALREASDRAKACRVALESDCGASLDALEADLRKLGTDPVAALRKRRQQLTAEADAARKAASSAANERTLADERVRNLAAILTEAIQARDAALVAFPEGIAEALAAAQAAVVAADIEKQTVAAEFTALKRTIEERTQRMDVALAGARRDVEEAGIASAAAQQKVMNAKTNYASKFALLGALQKQREAEDLASSERKLDEARKRLAALPVAERAVTAGEVSDARAKAASLASELQVIGGEVQRAHGALEQVGGAVARERLRDAVEAFELAQRLEKETEANYEAWKMLLEQMKEADAAQASNLGQTLAPAIAVHFQALTQKRYDNVRLSPHLETEGIVVGGSIRDAERMSVGTREQLSTLYRLCLAEYLKTMIVLDDQLVQSDEGRMDWFRALLYEKARIFQIVVFTCRPDDYLRSGAMASQGNELYADTNDGFVRAIDLGRALAVKK